MTLARIGSWCDVEELLRGRPPGTVLRVPRSWVEHPRARGMKVSVGLPAGQVADFVERIDETTGLEVTAYQGHYIARLFEIEPGRNPRTAARAPSPALGNGVALGALLGAALGRTERALVVGAALGCLFSAGTRST